MGLISKLVYFLRIVFIIFFNLVFKVSYFAFEFDNFISMLHYLHISIYLYLNQLLLEDFFLSGLFGFVVWWCGLTLPLLQHSLKLRDLR